MKFDIAITSFKRPALVKEAVVSCLSQGPLLNKVIVVDDASHDDTPEVIRSLNDPRIVFAQRTVNGGIAAARRDAFALSDADWLISLDSDHELLPGAIEGMARLLASAEESVDILGGRYQWDTGGVTPKNVPNGIIAYRERIQLSAQKGSIGQDYLCAISKRVRQAVQWEPLRATFPDVLFQLDIAKIGKAKFTPDILALQKSTGAHGWTRGSAEQRWARRCQDAPDVLKAMGLILSRHEGGLRLWGTRLIAQLYRETAFYAVLCGQRVQAWRWLASSFKLEALSLHSIGLAALIVLPHNSVRSVYLLRG